MPGAEQLGSTRVSMGAQRRLVLPEKLCAELGIHAGVSLAATVENGALVLRTHEALLAHLHALVGKPGRDLTADFLAERRAEAARERR